jgi:hypothetical protein
MKRLLTLAVLSAIAVSVAATASFAECAGKAHKTSTAGITAPAPAPATDKTSS